MPLNSAGMYKNWCLIFANCLISCPKKSIKIKEIKQEWG